MRAYQRYPAGGSLSGQILEAARYVHRCLGPDHSENYYRRAMTNVLSRQNLLVESLFPVDVWQNQELANLYFLDLFVEYQVIVNVRSLWRPFTLAELDEMAEQVYASSSSAGLLVNFGRRRLEYEWIR